MVEIGTLENLFGEFPTLENLLSQTLVTLDFIPNIINGGINLEMRKLMFIILNATSRMGFIF